MPKPKKSDIALVLDFETYSESDLTAEGSHKYADDPTTKPLCLSYKIDTKQTKIWVCTDEPPEELVEAAKLVVSRKGYAYAFNATFDLQIWNKICTKKWDLPFIPLDRWIDIMAVCLRFRLPQSLAKAAEVLKCDTQKMAVGKRLIRKCSKPNGNPTAQDYTDLYQYCIVDTDVLYEIMTKLPVSYLTDFEQRVWEMTFNMNELGVPIDSKTDRAIIKYLKVYMASQKELLPEVTGGYIQTPGQVQKIKAYCKMKGFELPNLQAETVEKALENTDGMPEDVRTVLSLRQELGKSSVKKFITLDQMNNKGWVQGNLIYHKAGTGRWAGCGFQYHNLPRHKHKDPESFIEKFCSMEPMENPVNVAKGLIRPMIMAPEDHMLIVSDYSSIENRVLAWLAGDEHTLDGFRNDFDQYKDMASFLFKTPYESVNSSQRQLGKALVLGCGFGMSYKRFVVASQVYGIKATDGQAKEAVSAYRAKYALIVKMWYRLANAVMNACKFPGKSYMSNKCTCQVVKDKSGMRWLRITLPSGRALMYNNPKIGEGKFGPAVFYKGILQKTYQWVSKELTPGLITENVTQASARDVLTEGMLEVTDKMPQVRLIMCVHDEAGSVIHNNDIHKDTLDTYNRHLCCNRDYRVDMPIQAIGYIEKRYKKD